MNKKQEYVHFLLSNQDYKVFKSTFKKFCQSFLKQTRLILKKEWATTEKEVQIILLKQNNLWEQIVDEYNFKQKNCIEIKKDWFSNKYKISELCT
jgi:hypothetical protein